MIQWPAEVSGSVDDEPSVCVMRGRIRLASGVRIMFPRPRVIFPPCWRLCVALFLGVALTYWLLVPPWWHYDEPRRFALAWQLAREGFTLGSLEPDPDTQRAIVASMLRYDWYHHYPKATWPHPETDPPPYPGAGIDNTRERLYYFLAAVPLRFVSTWPVEHQLRLVRLVSVVLFGLTLGAAWAALGEVLPPRHRLRWLIPAFMLTLPGFAEVMTGLSDDAGAALAGTLLLWAALRLVHRGITLPRVIGLLIAAVAAWWTKNTLWPLVVVLVPLAFYFRLLRRRIPWAWAGLVALALLAVRLGLERTHPAYWYEVPWVGRISGEPPRTRVSQAVLGEWALTVSAPGYHIGQWLPQGARWRNREVTLAGWAWADEPVRVAAPRVCTTSDCSPVQSLDLGPEPAFFVFTAQMPEGRYPRVMWQAFSVHRETTVRVYMDALVLVEGTDWPTTPPEFADAEGRTGVWGGRAFRNGLRNPSAEHVRWGLRPWAQRLLLPRLPSSPEVALAALQDPAGVRDYARVAALTLYRTFWGYLARNKVPLLGGNVLYFGVLGPLTVVGLVAGGVAAWQRRRALPWPQVSLLLLAVLVQWGYVVVWGLGLLWRFKETVPWARYIGPAMLPTVAWLVVGWYTTLRAAQRRGWLSVPPEAVILTLGGTLSAVAWVSLGRYFQPDRADAWLTVLVVALFLLAVEPVQRLMRRWEVGTRL